MTTSDRPECLGSYTDSYQVDWDTCPHCHQVYNLRCGYWGREFPVHSVPEPDKPLTVKDMPGRTPTEQLIHHRQYYYYPLHMYLSGQVMGLTFDQERMEECRKVWGRTMKAHGLSFLDWARFVYETGEYWPGELTYRNEG